MALVSEIGEFGLIGRLRALDIVRGIGDDCAVMTPPPGNDLVMTADALVEGVHFRHEWISWEELGKKSVAVNFSDIAAMGAVPAGIVLTLGMKADVTAEHVSAFYDGMASIISFFGENAAIYGGDIIASPLATAISVTAFGYVETGKAVRRSGARPGDELWVTGYLGDSAAGLRLFQAGEKGYWPLKTAHNAPEPRVWQARAALGTGALRAMIDLSDGLAGDLGHVVEESGVGAIIEEAALPVSAHLCTVATRKGWDTTDLALHGGEDYELLMAVAPGQGDAVHAAVAQATGTPMARIGTIIEGQGITMVRRDGTREALEARAFRHF